MHTDTGKLIILADEAEGEDSNLEENIKSRLEDLDMKYEIMSREKAINEGFIEVPEELNEFAFETIKDRKCAFNSHHKPLRDFAKNTRRKIKLKRRMVKKSRRRNRRW